MKKFIYVLLLFFTLIVVYSQSQELSLQELCSLSSDILITKPISYTTFQSENKKHIYTNIKFEVIDKVKGRFAKHDKFEMLVYGGTLNGITQFVVDAPSYKIGEESLLFLKENRSKQSIRIFFTVTGGVQGKYDIYIDKNSRVKHLVKELSYMLSSNIENGTDDLSNLSKQPRLDDMVSSIRAEIVRQQK